jgi:hypothetical protein
MDYTVPQKQGNFFTGREKDRQFEEFESTQQLKPPAHSYCKLSS